MRCKRNICILLLFSLVLGCSKKRISSSEALNSQLSTSTDSIDISQLTNDRYYDSIQQVLKKVSINEKEYIVSQLSSGYYILGDSTKFRKWNKLNQNLSAQLNHTSYLAQAHWKLGNFFYKHAILDSAYYHYYRSKELYAADKDLEKEGTLLLNMAILQSSVKDFIGSEVTSIKAIKIFRKLNNKEKLSNVYNNLGVVSNGLQNYYQSLEFHSKAEKLEKELKKPLLRARSQNNKGVVYLDMKLYDKAIALFREALGEPELRRTNPRLYAMLLDNLAYASWKNGETKEIPFLFKKSYRIRDSIGHTAGMIINKIHYGEFSYEMGAKKTALQQLQEAQQLSKKTNNYEYLLESLLLLSKFDTLDGTSYLQDYIKINDSLVSEERKVQNKFARIRYETDEYIQETENLSEQKFWIIMISVSLFAIILLIYFLREQRIKNKELLFDKEQQLANEKIYKLLLDQQNKLEEGRNQERIRISEELHDGILGELFGTRLGLGILDLSLSDEASVQFNKLVNNLKNIESDVRKVSHDLRNRLVEGKFNSELNFINILKDYFEKILKNHEFEIEFKYDKNIEWDLVKDDVKIHIYRIIQESLQNIIKHSEASIVNMEIRYTENILSIKIQDNGKGFKIGKAKAGIGLKNIRSRAKKINADLKIVSEKGTLIILKIFLDYEK